MATSLGDRFAALGRRSPLVLSSCYAVVIFITAALSAELKERAPIVAALTIVLWLIAGLGLVIVSAWYREEDTVAVGILVALTVVVSGFASRIVLDMIQHRSVGSGILLFMSSLIPLLLSLLLVAPLSIAFVWGARQIAPGFGVTPASEPGAKVRRPNEGQTARAPVTRDRTR